MNISRLTACLCLPAALALEAGAWYAMRSVIFVAVEQGVGMDFTHAVKILSLLFSAAAFTPLVGGLICVVVPPRWMVVAGLTLFLPGYLLLALGQRLPPLLWLGISVLVAARGLFSPALFAAAAEAFADPAEAARNSLFFLFYAASNGMALLSSSLGGLAVSKLGTPPLFIVLAALVALALVPALIHAVLGSTPGGESTLSSNPQPLGLLVAAGAGLLVLGPELTAPLLRAVELSAAQRAWIYSVNPAVIVVATPLLAALTASFALNGLRTHLGYFLGGGLVLTALGGAALLLGGHQLGPTVVGQAVLALGEGAAIPVVLSRLAGVPARWSALSIAGWMAVSGLLGSLANLIPMEAAPWLLAPLAAVALLAGIALLALARPLAISRNTIGE